MNKIIFPGSFDPLTLGHLDLITRAAQQFDELIVLIVDTNNKIPIKKRYELLQTVIKTYHLDNVKIDVSDELLINYCQKHHINNILRGIRNINDYQYEQSLEFNNKILYDKLETFYLLASPQYQFISSSKVWEILKYHGDINKLVPNNIAIYLKEEYENL